MAGKNHVFGAVGDVGDYSLLPCSSVHSLARRSFSYDVCDGSLSARSLLLSDGESLPAISPVGAGATLMWGAAVQESLRQARQQIWVLPFLPVKSLVQLFQNSIVV